MDKLPLTLLFIFACFANAAGQKRDTFRVYFKLNDAAIDKKGNAFIDSLVLKKVLAHAQKLTVLGYADYLGSNGYNDTLSSIRARNVADRLITAGLKEADLQLCTGKGKIEREPVKGNKGYAADRLVMIITGWNTPPKDSLHIDVSRIRVNSRYPLNILFENSSSKMLPESAPELQKTLDFLNKYKSITIQIEGHICCRVPGSRETDGYDMKDGGRLSHNRAKVIYQYLIDHGIDPARMTYIGRGNLYPLVKELTEDDKKTNRRVEIKITSK